MSTNKEDRPPNLSVSVPPPIPRSTDESASEPPSSTSSTSTTTCPIPDKYHLLKFTLSSVPAAAPIPGEPTAEEPAAETSPSSPPSSSLPILSPTTTNLQLGHHKITNTLPRLPPRTGPKLFLTVKNTSPTTTYTLLEYSSPLDDLALALGNLSLTLLPLPSSSSSGTEKPLPTNRVFVKLVIPPPEDAFITLKPGEARSNMLVLGGWEVDVEGLRLKGREVRVRWTGRGWGVEGGVAVWEGGREEVLRGVREKGEEWDDGDRWFVNGGEGVVVRF